VIDLQIDYSEASAQLKEGDVRFDVTEATSDGRPTLAVHNRVVETTATGVRLSFVPVEKGVYEVCVYALFHQPVYTFIKLTKNHKICRSVNNL
jgi:hypothetical protein